jgi:NAD(P)H-flavin reductase
MQTFKATLFDKKILPGNVYHLFLTLQEPKEIQFVEGQYIILSIPNTPPVRRLYSIASSSQKKDQIELIIKHVEGGIASHYISTSL